MTAQGKGDARAFAAEAKRLKGLGRLDEALVFNRRAVAASPDSVVAAHNLAATLGDLSRFAEAEAAAARAQAKGLDAPETWLVRARALQGLGRLDEAEAAFEQAIARRPGDAAAHRDLAQLRWMRSGDVHHALARLEHALASAPTVDLVLLKARTLEAAGAPRAALDLLEEATAGAAGLAPLHQAAAHAAATLGDAVAQRRHAELARHALAGSPGPLRDVCEALLHTGEVAAAERILTGLIERSPDDQGLLALLTTAWRLQGDPRAKAYCEDPALVSLRPIEAPAGWSDLPGYLRDLAAALRGLHHWQAHPLDQSLRHGSQTQADLARSDDPAVRALFAALDGPIRAHIAALGPGDDPVRRRCTGRYRIAGAWSVLLRPGGFHRDHVHPQGWLSSAFYVELPDVVERGHEGWLALGRPGIPTTPPLAPLRRLRPEAGHLALFPSYLWHGTEPFGGDRPRLTVAFDVVPA